jgi:hypothetical protein
MRDAYAKNTIFWLILIAPGCLRNFEYRSNFCYKMILEKVNR